MCIVTMPEASGRLFDFFGCSRSVLMSWISLTMYVADEARQNSSAACRALLLAIGFRNSPQKINGANTKTFLIHCFGRIRLINPTNRHRVVYVVTVSLIYSIHVIEKIVDGGNPCAKRKSYLILALIMIVVYLHSISARKLKVW